MLVSMLKCLLKLEKLCNIVCVVYVFGGYDVDMSGLHLTYQVGLGDLIVGVWKAFLKPH